MSAPIYETFENWVFPYIQFYKRRPSLHLLLSESRPIMLQTTHNINAFFHLRDVKGICVSTLNRYLSDYYALNSRKISLAKAE
jgi:hypothetical protein